MPTMKSWPALWASVASLSSGEDDDDEELAPRMLPLALSPAMFRLVLCRWQGRCGVQGVSWPWWPYNKKKSHGTIIATEKKANEP
jgi:hypothetical protein